jgi:protein TonB
MFHAERSRLLGFLLLSLLLHGALYLSQRLFVKGDERVGKPLDPVEVALLGPTGPAPNAAKTLEPKSQAAPEKKISPPPKPAQPKPAAPKARPEIVREAPKAMSEKQQSKPEKQSPDRSQATSESSNTSTASKAPESPASTGGAPSSPAASSQAGGYEGPKVAAYLHNPKPEYPPMAKRREWEGRVILKVRVLASGTAGEVSIATSSGHDILDESALEAVKHWRFIPAKRGGQPVDSWVNVPLNFSLLDSK